LDDAEDQNQRQNKTEGKLAFCGAALRHLFRPVSQWRLCYCNEASTMQERVSRIDPYPKPIRAIETSQKMIFTCT
jgi:hypothetical protein